MSLVFKLLDYCCFIQQVLILGQSVHKTSLIKGKNDRFSEKKHCQWGYNLLQI